METSIEVPSWEEYALDMAWRARRKSKDPWIKVGACLLRHDNTIAATGFNGFPKKVKEDWSNRDERRRKVVHAEANALRYVKPGEVRLCATTLLPCNDCLKNIASYEISRVVYQDIYQFDPSSLQLAEELGIELVQMTLEEYATQTINPR